MLVSFKAAIIPLLPRIKLRILNKAMCNARHAFHGEI
jgi:hypothetical protein